MGRIRRVAVLAVVMLWCCAGWPAWAQSPTSSLQHKVAAVLTRDLQVDLDERASELRILVPPGMSLPADAKLRVVSVRPGFSAGSWLVRVDCSARTDCLPFHVVLHATALDANERTGTARMHASAGQSLPKSTSSLRQVSSPLARSGDRMLLVEQRPGMRLQARVVCLESGALGDAIRVRNLATHRVLLATVVGKAEVRVE
jgi:hypothetical protein